MHFIKFSLLSLSAIASLAGAQAPPDRDIGISEEDSFCPPCQGNKYINPDTGNKGCCPSGTIYEPGSCVPWDGTITNPQYPQDCDKIYKVNGVRFKIVCGKTTNHAPELGEKPASSANECAKLCANNPLCETPTYNVGRCWMPSAKRDPSTFVNCAGCTTFIRQHDTLEGGVAPSTRGYMHDSL